MEDNRFLLFDRHLNRLTDLPIENVMDPLVIQDLDSGEDRLNFSYPIESHENLEHTWLIYAGLSWNEVDEL